MAGMVDKMIDARNLEPLIDSIINVAEFFTTVKGDCSKAKLWFRTPNPLLGELAPVDMLMLGMEKKLIHFIQEQLLENAVNPRST